MKKKEKIVIINRKKKETSFRNDIEWRKKKERSFRNEIEYLSGVGSTMVSPVLDKHSLFVVHKKSPKRGESSSDRKYLGLVQTTYLHKS